MTWLIEAAGLTKRYGRVAALRGIDLVARPGQVLALLGPNGAGKTTFVRLLATLARPDSGHLRITGLDVVRQDRQVRRVIGLAGQHAAVEPTMTGRENLEMFAQLFGLSRGRSRAAAAEVLARLDLAGTADRRVSTYSGGTRRRLDVAASLVGRPRLLLLDEPTTGLDPRGRRQLWDLLAELVRDGTDLLLTTQYLEEADQLADRIVILDRGRVVADGAPDDLKNRLGGHVVTIHARHRDDLPRLAAMTGPTATVDPELLTVSWTATSGGEDAARAFQQLTGAGVPISEITVRRPSLDEVFLHLTEVPA